MGISIDFAETQELQANIKVIGVGGGGGNALNTMVTSGLEGVEFIAANTDAQALETSLAHQKVQLGGNVAKGLGAGGNPEFGRKSALEDVQRITEAVHGADMVFITAGMGGGTGTGAAPIIAQIARDHGALTVGVVTRPFLFEGRKRYRNAEQGIRELVESVDTIITIPNQKLVDLDSEDLSLLEAFQRADDVLVQAVRGISDLIVNAGMINVDFADVKTIMSSTGRALMGTGVARGENRALEAAQMAINSPLLDDISVEGAMGILLNFTAGPDIRLREINEAATLVQQEAHEDANIIFGVVTDPDMTDTVKVTVIATGFDMPSDQEMHVARARQAHSYSNTGARPRSSISGSAFGSGNSASATSAGSVSAPEAPRRSSYPAISAQAEEPARRPSAPAQEAPGSRAFGASAMHDEAVLDIPAYLRRSSGNNSTSRKS